MKCGIFYAQKRRVWIWKAYCRTTKQLIDWECGARDSEMFRKMYEQLKKRNVNVFCSDRYSVYCDFISHKRLIQTKTEMHLIDGDNFFLNYTDLQDLYEKHAVFPDQSK